MRTFPSTVIGTGAPMTNRSVKNQVAGMTCITPTAPTPERTWFWKPDSCQARARTSSALTP